MTSTITPYRSDLRAGRDGFAQLLRAEWTKFRTVRGWVLTMTAAALATVLLGLGFSAASHSSCSEGPIEVACPIPPLGPGGEAVRDRLYFVNRPLTGDGSITARLTSMSGIITYPPPNHDQIVPGLVPWAKAGLIIKQSIKQGSAYAAVMVTGSHGVRMQHNFTHDTGGGSTTFPRWLRLTRSGDILTGYESADGKQWTKVGTADLTGLPDTVRIGLFANSPGDLTVEQGSLGGSNTQLRFTQTTAVFDQVSVQGDVPRGAWSRDDVGVDGKTDWERYRQANGLVESGGTLTVSGTGDIAPISDGQSIERTLIGALVGLIAVMVVAVLFITAEYRRGLIRTSLLASPRRGRVLAAKATVIGLVTFTAGLVSAAVTVPICTRILRANGTYPLPVSPLTELRVIVGTAALLAAAAVFALGLGALFRRSAVAITVAVATVLLPYLLATVSSLPLGVSQWLLRLTPAAGFAIQQSVQEYPQVLAYYAPQMGYFPLAPWAGLAVLGGYAALALGLAILRVRRKDA
ncbi:ABC transporter permease subunit [Nonomuraea sp. NPDC049269]|uniref:ABC transporter permease subunit n=1 Tax=Nonomuraea sp. NPDC049269 TaxID=3364349 RepID=UPI00372153EC